MEPRGLDENEQAAWSALLDLCRQLGSGMERHLAESGVSGADHRLLVALSEAPDGLLRPRDLGAAVGWDRSRLSHQLRRMEQRNLVTHEVCATDGRGTLVRLTPQGLAAVRRAAPGYAAWVRTHFTDLATGEQLTAVTFLAETVAAKLATEAEPCRDDVVECL